jgi:uracil-DNA glycosylase
VTAEERRGALEAIAAEVTVCTNCRLSAGRARAVPGEGHPDTEVVLVGEGPGFNEDQQGRPFVGAAGGFLNDLLGTIRWRRDEVFITNVVKCRPPGNRDPEPDEIAACAPFLRRQLEVLDPALVVTLGRFSMQTFMPGARIGQAHGTVRPAHPDSGAPDALAFAMYHPAAAFRQQALRDTMKRDVCSIPDALLKAREIRAGREDANAPARAPKQVEASPVIAGATPAIDREPADSDSAATTDPAIIVDPTTADAMPGLAAGWAESGPAETVDVVPPRDEQHPGQLSFF